MDNFRFKRSVFDDIVRANLLLLMNGVKELKCFGISLLLLGFLLISSPEINEIFSIAI